MSLVTVLDLRSEIKSYTYEQLTEGDDAVAERAIDKARIWVGAKLARISGVEFDEDSDSTDFNIILKRALYELYSYGEMESVATDKKNDAFELLTAKYGVIDSTNQQAESDSKRSTPAGAIVKPEINKESF